MGKGDDGINILLKAFIGEGGEEGGKGDASLIENKLSGYPSAQTKANEELTTRYSFSNKWFTLIFVLFHVKYRIFNPLAWSMALIQMTLNTQTT